jgi:IS5 family transposase
LFADYLSILEEIKVEIQELITTGLKEYSEKEQERIIDLERQIGIIYKNAYQFQIEGKKIENEDKIFSIYEEHTDILVKGIRDIVFGHKVNLSSGKSNLILTCEIVKGNPKDSQLFLDPIIEIKEEYKKEIKSIVTDGGYASKTNVKKALKENIINIVFTKVVGSLKSIAQDEKIEKILKKWRAGIEAVISNLKRGFDLQRVTWRGEAKFEAKVFWSVIGYNIRVLTGHIMETLQKA